MPAVKILCKIPSPQRKKELWETLGEFDIHPHRIHEANKAYFVIVTQEETERTLKEDVVRKLKELNMEVTTPLDYNSSKTVIIKRLDPIIDEYEAEEIKQSIERANNNIEVEDVFVFPTTSKIMKVRLGTSAMAQKVLENRLLVLNQRVKPYQVEKEIFIKITPCTNSYKYDHVTSRCPQEKMLLCAFLWR